jgi:taurine dioxygenase
LKGALRQYLVIFFEDQDISPEAHRSFGSRFGRLQIHQYLPSLDGFPEIVVLENDEARKPQVNFWHADVTFLKEPPLGSILLAREIPPYGGDTLWTNMYAAYEALSDKMRHFLSGLTALHVGRLAEYEAAYGRSPGASAEPPQAEHPVVRIHPETGKGSIYVHPAATTRIVGMSQAESDALLQMLYRHAQTPEFQVRFRWQKNAVAFWDNRCTQHYAVADYWPMRRVMHRVTLDGDRLQ